MKRTVAEELPLLDDVECDVCGPQRQARVEYDGLYLCSECRDRIQRRNAERERALRELLREIAS